MIPRLAASELALCLVEQVDAMPPLEDHVRFMSAIDYIDDDFRAVYRVSLGAGSHRSGIRRFGALVEARAWLEDEARRHGAELVCEEQL